MKSISCTKIKNCQEKFFGTKLVSKALIQKNAIIFMKHELTSSFLTGTTPGAGEVS